MTLSILEVDTANRRHVKRFVRLPFRLYEDNAQWVPPFLSEARLQLDRKRYPFYKRNDAAFFLARRDGQSEDAGRICVIHPVADNEINGRQDAYFYLFECVDDQTVADALFDAAAGWARARGLIAIKGPLGFLAGDGFGMLAEGFEHHPAIGIPYNHAYYPKLAETWGFEVEERLFSGYMDADRLRDEFPEKVLRLAEHIKSRYGFTVKEFKTKRELTRWVAPRLGEVYDRAFTHVHRDRHLTPDQLEAIARRLLMVSDPRLLKFVVKDEAIVGFLFCFLDVSDGLRKAGGRLFPFGWFYILRDLRRTTWINLNGMGVLPEYQGRGGPALMYAELYHALAPIPRIKHAEAVQINASNTKSLNEAKQFGTDFYKTHNVYRKPL